MAIWIISIDKEKIFFDPRTNPGPCVAFSFYLSFSLFYFRRFLSFTLHLILWDKSFTEPEAPVSVTLAGQQGPKIHLSLPFQCIGWQASTTTLNFQVGAEGPNSGPRVYTARPLIQRAISIGPWSYTFGEGFRKVVVCFSQKYSCLMIDIDFGQLVKLVSAIFLYS